MLLRTHSINKQTYWCMSFRTAQNKLRWAAKGIPRNRRIRVKIGKLWNYLLRSGVRPSSGLS